MKLSWILAAGLMFGGSVFADDEKPKTDEAKKEAKVEATSTVTVMVVDEDGKVIKKSTTSESKNEGETKVQVEVVDGKQVIELILPDGTRKKINIAGEAKPGNISKVMSWTFRADDSGKDVPAELKKAQEKLEKMLKDVDVDVKVDAAKIQDQVKQAIIKVGPIKEMADGIASELLVELGDSAIVVAGEEESGDEGPKVRRPFQIRRLSAAGDGMTEVMKKLEEITKRLEKIEARLDEMTKE